MVFEIRTNINTTISIRDLTIRPNDKAIIKYYYRDGVEFSKGTLILEGDAYKNWGNDDNYLIAFLVKTVCGSNVEPVDESGATIDVVFREQTPNISSSASVHNENDIKTIENLQSQLDIQTQKLQKMVELLISKGLI